MSMEVSSIECSLPVEFFSQLIRVTSFILECVNFEISPNGLKYTSMDSGRISLIAVEIPKSDFVSFRCDNTVVLGIPIKPLFKTLKFTRPKDILKIQYNEKNPDIVCLTSKSPEGRHLDFQLKLYDIDAETIQIPPTKILKIQINFLEK